MKSLIVDAMLVAGVVLGAMFVADRKAKYPHQWNWLKSDRTEHLGAEYNSIAEAIMARRGFSDPFREPTGPTAWMAPVLPYLLATVYWLSDSSQAAAVEFMVGVQVLAALLAGWIVMREARRLHLLWLGVPIFIGGCAANFHLMFQKTHDNGWLLLLVSLLWLGSVRLWRRPPHLKTAVGWGAFGGVCALSNPIVGAAWGTLTAWSWLLGQLPTASEVDSDDGLSPNRQSTELVAIDVTEPAPTGRQSIRTPDSERPWLTSRGVRATAMAAFVSILVVAPWTIRNRMVLGEWMPIKSNAMYELWQSQCLDNDGVLDISVLGKHPWGNSGQQRQRYAKVGEVTFIDEKGAEVRAAIAADPLDYLTRVANRLTAVFFYYIPLYGSDRAHARGDGWPLFLKRLVFPLPLVGLMLILALRPVPLEPEVTATVAIWFLILLPYVLISYYDRYAIPVIGMKMLLILYAIHSLTHWYCRTSDPIVDGH